MSAKILRSLRGTRAAPSRWEALYAEALESSGFAPGKASACCFHRPVRGVKCVARGGERASCARWKAGRAEASPTSKRRVSSVG
eukprot:12250523-Alexandrium_andersonii.AAC.1